MGRSRKYTNEEFIEAVKNSFSIRSVLKKIGVRPTGGNYEVAKRRIREMQLDVSHLTGQGHLKGKTHNWAKKIPIDKLLVKDSGYGVTSHQLKNRLIAEGYFERKCYECGRKKWRGKLIPIELEHINGNRFDNKIENLMIICPNCHALTPTHRGKNKGRYS